MHDFDAVLGIPALIILKFLVFMFRFGSFLCNDFQITVKLNEEKQIKKIIKSKYMYKKANASTGRVISKIDQKKFFFN